jgi:hypothetical protein
MLGPLPGQDGGTADGYPLARQLAFDIVEVAQRILATRIEPKAIRWAVVA